MKDENVATLVERLPRELQELIDHSKKHLSEPLDCVNDAGASLAEVIDREIAAGHYKTALYLLAPMVSLTRAREVLTGKPDDYTPGLEMARQLGEALIRQQQSLGVYDLGDTELDGNAVMETIKSAIEAAIGDKAHVHVHEIRAGRKLRPSSGEMN